MEPAVTTVLIGVLCQFTAWDELGNVPIFARFQVEVKDRFLAFTGPHSRRNLWQPQANGKATDNVYSSSYMP